LFSRAVSLLAAAAAHIVYVVSIARLANNTAGRGVGGSTMPIVVVSAAVGVGVVIRATSGFSRSDNELHYFYSHLGPGQVLTCWSSDRRWGWKRRYHSLESSSDCPREEC
jgi:hypothetical protein